VLVDRAIVAAAISMLKVAAKPRTNNIAPAAAGPIHLFVQEVFHQL
jgi:hypothetical protein